MMGDAADDIIAGFYLDDDVEDIDEVQEALRFACKRPRVCPEVIPWYITGGRIKCQVCGAVAQEDGEIAAAIVEGYRSGDAGDGK